jgi:hypothetical protein
VWESANSGIATQVSVQNFQHPSILRDEIGAGYSNGYIRKEEEFEQKEAKGAKGGRIVGVGNLGLAL